LPFWGAFRRSTALKIEAAGNALIDADKYVCQVAGDVAGCADSRPPAPIVTPEIRSPGGSFRVVPFCFAIAR
jgi:hypothetical protein